MSCMQKVVLGPQTMALSSLSGPSVSQMTRIFKISIQLYIISASSEFVLLCCLPFFFFLLQLVLVFFPPLFFPFLVLLPPKADLIIHIMAEVVLVIKVQNTILMLFSGCTECHNFILGNDFFSLLFQRPSSLPSFRTSNCINPYMFMTNRWFHLWPKVLKAWLWASM